MTAKLIPIACKVMLSLLLAVIVGALVVLTVIPRAVDGAALTVLTGSMTPEIAVGSVVVVRPVDPGTLQVGDVVTYQKTPGQEDYVTHRIQDIHTDTDQMTLTTKGDANRGADTDPVPVTSVRGKVLFSVPYLGTVRNTIGVGGSGLILLVLGLVAYALGQVGSVLRERRRKPTPTLASPTEPVVAPTLTVTPTAPTVLASSAAAEGDLQLQLLVATLSRAEFEGLSASSVARLLRMDLVDEGPGTFTVALTREPEQLDTLVHLLAGFRPVRLVRSDVIEVPACDPRPASEATVRPLNTDESHAAA